MTVYEESGGNFSRVIEEKDLNALPEGDVLIRVQYSSLNYKDALSASGNKGVSRYYPHTPGIDAAGIIEESTAPDLAPGDEVICMGYDLGMNTSGGFGQYIRVPDNWVIPKPSSLTLKETMQIGTAGFTAAQCLLAFEENNVLPSNGPVLVTGATGGAGLISCMLLVQLGYEVHALTGKTDQSPLLKELGVSKVHDRSLGMEGSDKLLLKARWAGAVDSVGGQVLANVIKSMQYDGVVTSFGNAMSADLPLNVYPFILRGVHVVGIYSAECPMERRKTVWKRLASDLYPKKLEQICSSVTLEKVSEAIEQMLAGKLVGRKLVEVDNELSAHLD